jgi:acyl-CoA thioesterase FadM
METLEPKLAPLDQALELAPSRVKPEWIDYNGHMNVAYYVLAFDKALDNFCDRIDVGAAYVKRTNQSIFTLEMHVHYRQEVLEGDPLRFTFQLLDADEKRMHYRHLRADRTACRSRRPAHGALARRALGGPDRAESPPRGPSPPGRGGERHRHPAQVGVRGLAKAAIALGIALISIAAAAPAVAQMPDCAAPPAPDVNWQRCHLTDRDLPGIDVTGGNLREANFSASDLSGAKLIDIDGRRARFTGTKLKGAALDKAVLREADLTRADLSGASLKGADLRRARLFRANLRGADLTNAQLDGADLLHAEMAGATWIDGRTRCGEGSTGQCRAAR